jgi:hypothetical protein
MRSLKAILLGLIISLTSVSLFGQTDSVSYNSQVQLNLVNGYSLSYLNFLSTTSALRYKLDFYLGFSDGDNDGNSNNYSNNSNSYSDNFSSNNKSNTQTVSFSTQYMFYPVNNTIVKMFVGSGPYLELYRSFRKSDENRNYTTDGNEYSNSGETLNYSLALGVSGAFGIECFITNQISLIGEYEVHADYSWGKQKSSSSTNNYSNGIYSSGYSNNSESNSSGWSIGLGSLRLGVGFRF